MKAKQRPRNFGIALVVVLFGIGLPVEATGPCLSAPDRAPRIEEILQATRSRCGGHPGLKGNKLGTFNADLTCSGFPEGPCTSNNY